MKYKNAFKCNKCPQTNNENGCPAWSELLYTNIATGEEKIEKECSFQAVPKMMAQVVMASNRPAAAVESMRNEMVQGLGAIAEGVKALPYHMNGKDHNAIS